MKDKEKENLLSCIVRAEITHCTTPWRLLELYLEAEENNAKLDKAERKIAEGIQQSPDILDSQIYTEAGSSYVENKKGGYCILLPFEIKGVPQSRGKKSELGLLPRQIRTEGVYCGKVSLQKLTRLFETGKVYTAPNGGVYSAIKMRRGRMLLGPTSHFYVLDDMCLITADKGCFILKERWC